MSALPILTKFTTHLKQSLKHSFKLSLELGQKEVTPLTLLYGLSMEKGSVGNELLKKENITKDEIIAILLSLKKFDDARVEHIAAPTLSSGATQILERAAILTLENSHRYVGTEHLLAAILDSRDGALQKLFDKHKNSKTNIEQELTNVLNSINRFPEITSMASGTMGEPMPAGMPMPETKNRQRPRKNQALEFFTTDLTAGAALKKMDPVVGREKEISRLIQILCRRQKNNPVLLGDPGVGKTAIVEGLAQKISKGEVPDDLLGKKVLRLDIGLLIAGTIYRGEFEGRLKQLLDEIRQDPNIIIFIDELHTIVGAGSASGTLDAANILKPALARGEMRCIGATTFEEFKKSIESDPALERRFQSIIVREPTKTETLQILKGVSVNYEKYHNLKISDGALLAAVNLSDRYQPEKFFPDKALDLLDEASSAKKLQNTADSTIRKIKKLEQRLQELQNTKQQAILDENFKSAGALKKQETEMAKELQELTERGPSKKRKKIILEESDVATVVAQITGLPLTQVVNEQRLSLLNLEQDLKKKIIGQDDIISSLVKTLKRGKVGLANPNRPLASFLFVGPSGVGKTELAKTLAELYFPAQNTRDNFIRVDMSEFKEGFHSAKLVGAPAGYVGYKEGNQLADKIKNHPHSVILFDEIDKAHPDVFNIFLQILDEGRLTDASGKKINFKNTIIIMTANPGEEFFQANRLGFGSGLPADKNSYEQIKKNVLGELKNHFKIEFLNRLDQILVFHSLNLENLVEIAELQINGLNERIKEKEVNLEISTEAKNLIAQIAAPMDQGARAIYKIIQNQIEEPLSDWLLENEKTKKNIAVEIDKNKKTLRLKI